MAIDGPFAVAGAPGGETGAAHVFAFGAAGWSEVAGLLPSDPEALGFGYAVAVSGDAILVGAPWTGTGNEGAVFAFERSGGAWVDAGVLVASDAVPGDLFGSLVALDGDQALVGCAIHREHVHAFERVGGAWVEQQILTSSAPDSYFGLALAVEGTTAVVGAPFDDEGGSNAGAVHTFELSGGTWTKVDKHVGGGGLGRSLALDGGRALVRRGPAEAVVLERAGAGWSEVASVQAPYDPDRDDFVEGVDLSGDLALLGHPGEGGLGFPSRGTVYAFRADDGSWRPFARLRYSGSWLWDNFGTGLAVDGERALIGNGGDWDSTMGFVWAFALPGFVTPYCGCAAGAPCGNEAGFLSGCGSAGSFSYSAYLTAAGSSSVTLDDLVLRADGVPDDRVGRFAMGSLRRAGGLLPFSNGKLCVGGARFWFPATSTGSHPGPAIELGPGIVAASSAFPAAGQIAAGQTWNFQAWYHDPGGHCGAGSNTSNAVAITFAP